VQLELAGTDPPARLTEDEPATAVTVPPQLLARSEGVATTRPEGRASVKANPVRATVLFGLVTVRVSEVVVSSGMVAAPNALLITGGATTVSIADAVLPVPAFVEVTALVVLVKAPATVPVTSTNTTQAFDPPETVGATVAPDMVILVDPGVAVTVPPPQFLTVRSFGENTTSPAGKVSVKETPVRVTVLLGLTTARTRPPTPLSGMLGAEKTLSMSGGPITVIEAVAVLPVPPLVEVACTLLFSTNPIVPTTFSDTVQLELAAIDPPARLTKDEPAAAVTVPPQLLLRLEGVATSIPGGRMSANETPVRLVLLFGLPTVIVSEVVPFARILAAPNALLITGGATTVMEADAAVPVPPLLEVGVVVLVKVPAEVPVTSTNTTQAFDPPETVGATVAPDMVILVDPGVAVTVGEPQFLTVRSFGENTTSPAGKVSVKPTPFKLSELFSLTMARIRPPGPPSGMVAAENCLTITGGVSDA
jgi:hypothetical protein